MNIFEICFSPTVPAFQESLNHNSEGLHLGVSWPEFNYSSNSSARSLHSNAVTEGILSPLKLSVHYAAC